MTAALLLAAALASDPAAALREADAAMSRAVAARDVAALAGWVDEEAIWAGAAGLMEGRAAVLAGWARFTAPGGDKLSWAPREAVLSASGDLGYTVGDYRWEGKDADGKPATADGRYLTVWRKGKDGVFQALFDVELERPSPGPARARTARRTAAAAAGDLAAEIGTWSAAGGARGGYLAVRRRGPTGALVTAVETSPAFAR